MTKILFSLVLTLFPGLVLGDDWTGEQKILSAIAITAVVIDYGQTRTIALSSELGWYEKNPLLPAKPTLGEVNRHFILIPLATYFVLDYLPSDKRTIALYALTAVQVAIVAHNYSLGVRVSF